MLFIHPRCPSSTLHSLSPPQFNTSRFFIPTEPLITMFSVFPPQKAPLHGPLAFN